MGFGNRASGSTELRDRAHSFFAPSILGCTARHLSLGIHAEDSYVGQVKHRERSSETWSVGIMTLQLNGVLWNEPSTYLSHLLWC